MAVNEEFCRDLPTWPGCEVFNQPEPVNTDGKMMDDGYMKEAEADPMMGQLTYTMTAVMLATNAALTLFRYDDKYDASALDDEFPFSNWIDTYRSIMSWSELAFFGVASITQIATLFGAMADINLMVWWYGGMFMGLVNVGISAIMFWARDEVYEEATAYGVIESDATKMMAHSASLTLSLWMEYDNWMAAQWALLDDETKDAWENDMLVSVLF